MEAKEHYRAGRLAEAIAAATEDVKSKPADVSCRRFLCELLCFAGDLDRADRQIDTVSQLDPKQAVGVSLIRQLLRAEQARRQFYGEGRLPEFLEKPSPEQRLRLEASILLREGKGAEAAELLESAEAERSPVSGTCNGKAFDDLRDLDDLSASNWEVFTSTGKFYWIPIETVQLLEFPSPEQPRDLLWRRAHMVVRDGPDGEVYLPVLYSGSHSSDDDDLRLGRATDWQGGDGTPVRGVGQRTLLVGEGDMSIMELEKIELNQEKSDQS